MQVVAPSSGTATAQQAVSSIADGSADGTAIKSEDEPSASTKGTSSTQVAAQAADQEMVDLGGEVSDGEIMDENESKDIVVMNKMQQVAADALRSRQKHEKEAVESALASKVKYNPEEESKEQSASASVRGSKAIKNDNLPIAGLPEDMLCAICYNARKSVMIQTCKHLVFCT